jgi:quinoprotein glucose dehydrogenase
MPAHPILIDVNVNGRPVKAVVQWGKNGIAYVFDRTNGQPLWGWEERAVPASTVPGEKLAATQPFPLKPVPFERLGLTEDALIDFTPQLRAEALKALEGYQWGKPYQPPSVVSETNKGTVILPGYGGGGNWQSGAADPETGFVYIPSITSISTIGLNKNDPTRSDPARPSVDSDYTMGGPGPQMPSRPADRQAAVRPHHRLQHEHRRHRLDDSQRRHAAEYQEQPGARRPQHPENRQSVAGWPAGHQDPADRRRGFWRTAGAARLRQGNG